MHKVAGWVLIGALLVSLLLSACGGDDQNGGDKNKDENSKPLTPVTVQLSWAHEAEYAGFYAAIEQGFYEREGLAVTLKEGGFNDAGYIDPITIVADGSAQFGLTNGQSLLRAYDAGQPLVMIAAQFLRTPRVFISLAENGVVGPQDFVGKRVARREDIGVVYDLLYKAAGIKAEDVIEITDQALNSPQALIDGTVDVIPAFVTSEAVQLKQDGHAVNVILVSDYGIEDFQNIIFTTQSIIDENPDLVERFLRATLDGIKYAVDNPEAAAQLVKTYVPDGDLEFIQASMMSTVPLLQVAGTPIGSIDTTAWNDYVANLVLDGSLSSAEKVAGAYTTAFIDKLNSAQ